MATAEQLVFLKGGSIVGLAPDATVLEAAELMSERRIGSVLVIDSDQLIGIVTERDVLRHVVAAQRDPAATTLAEIMTSPVACAVPETELDEIRAVMRQRRLSHVPVLDGERVIGMVSIGDLNKSQREVAVQTIRHVESCVAVA